MKKLISFLVILVMLFAFIPSTTNNYVEDDANLTSYFVTPSIPDSRNDAGKHLILNNDGSYGGTLNEALYGKGAPLNGEYDVIESDYYYHGDYYNMKSNYTEDSKGVREYQRYIYPKFSPYQQTMQDSSGIACIVMILNYLGYDINRYSELALVKAYEKINQTTVYGNGTTPEGLVKLVNSLGLKSVTANNTEIDTSSYEVDANNDYEAIRKIFRQCILDGKFLVMRYQSPNGFGYKVLVGHDNKGTLFYSYSPKTKLEYPTDDYLIFAEPNDNYDHFQDGFTTNRMTTVIRWWFNMTADGIISNEHEYFIIDPSIDVDFQTDAEIVDKTNHLQEAYDIHLPLNGEEMWYNSSGVLNEYKKYGSTRNATLYGYIKSGGGLTNRPDLPYCKIIDYYKMGSEGSRILLPNYIVLQQTMSSSCGVCAVNSVLKYYGYYEDTSYYDLELLYTNAYDNHPGFADVVRSGTSNVYHKMTLESLGFTSHHYRSSSGEEPTFATYDNFVSFIKYNLLNDRPIVNTISPSGGHFVTIIGYDDMGTDHIYDDVVIIADSSDTWDGYQDGYNTYSATQYYNQFANGSSTYMYQCLVIYKN